MNNNIRIIIHGKKEDLNKTLAFLPDVALEKMDFVENIRDSLPQLKKEYASHSVVLLKSGLAVSIGFWEKILYKNFKPGEIVIYPVRIASDPPSDGIFKNYIVSDYEKLKPENLYELLNLDCVLSHGLTFFEILSDEEKHHVVSAMENAFSVSFDTSNAAYSIDERIFALVQEEHGVEAKIDGLLTDIRGILSGETKIERKADSVISGSNQMKISGEEKLSLAATNNFSAPQGSMSHYLNSKHMRDKIRSNRSKLSGNLPPDIEYRLKKK